MDWLLWSVLAVAVGMAGFWGGVLQHAHLNAGDGGSLTDYPRVLFRNNVSVEVLNTTVETTIWSTTVPASVWANARALRITVLGKLTQSTGVAANAPILRIKLDTGLCLISQPLSLPTSGPTRILNFLGYLTRLNGGTTDLWAHGICKFGLIASAAQEINNSMGGNPNVSTDTDKTLSLTVQNAVASVNYNTQIENTLVELI